MITIIFRVISIFTLVLIGLILNKRNILPRESVGYMTGLLLVVTVPALNFISLAGVPFEPEKLRSILEVSTGTFAYILIAFIVSFIVIKIVNPENKSDAGIYMITMSGINCAFMGFPITKSIFGDEYLFYMVIVNALCAFYVFFLIQIHFNYGEKNSNINILSSLKNMINIPFVATILGFLLFINSIKLNEVVYDFFDMLGAITSPLSMIVIGVQLGDIKLKKLIANRYLIIASFVKLIVLPLIVFIITYYMPLTLQAKVILPLATCFPTATVTSSMAVKLKKNDVLMAQGIAITTIFSVISVSIWCIILSKVYF